MSRDGPPPVHVIDDDPSVRKALGRLLTSAGREVRSWGGAVEFREGGAVGGRGILLLDLHMPEMGGFELLELLREEGSTLVVILMTAYVQDGDRERGLAAGAAELLVKPFEDTALLALLDRVG